MRALGFLALIGCHAGAGVSVDAGDAGVGVSADAVTDAAPAVTAPARLLDETALYPRAVQRSDGTILVSVVTPLPSGRMGGTILKSLPR